MLPGFTPSLHYYGGVYASGGSSDWPEITCWTTICLNWIVKIFTKFSVFCFCFFWHRWDYSHVRTGCVRELIILVLEGGEGKYYSFKQKLLLEKIWRNQSLFVLYYHFWLPCKTWKAAAKEAKIQRRVLPLLTAPPSLVKNVWLFTMKLERATLTVLSKTIIIAVSGIVGKLRHLDFSFFYFDLTRGEIRILPFRCCQLTTSKFFLFSKN